MNAKPAGAADGLENWRWPQPLPFAVVLDPCRAQACKPVLVDRCLPIQELVDAERIAGARFLEAEEAAAHGRNHFRLAPDNPAPGIRRWQISDRQRTPIGADDVLD